MTSTLKQVYQALRAAGSTPQQAKIALLNMEPFHQFRTLVASLDE